MHKSSKILFRIYPAVTNADKTEWRVGRVLWGGGIASLKTESRLKAMSYLRFYRALLALLSTDWNRPSDRPRHTCSLRWSSPTSHRSTAYHRAQNRRVWTEHSRIGTATSASGQSTRRWWWCYSLGWQWRNVVPYLCQLVFATILWVKLR